MPKLKPATQVARREHILDAAELCLARYGFHRTTMQDICREAGVSAGALYVYFASKEDLIAGICERDRAKFADELSQLGEAADLLGALGQLAQHYAIEQPAHKRILCLEMGVESTRNPAIAEIFLSVDKFVIESFARLFERAKDQGRIAPKLDPRTLAQVVAAIGDGMFWRRAVDPGPEPKQLVGVLMTVISDLINPINSPDSASSQPAKTKALT